MAGEIGAIAKTAMNGHLETSGMAGQETASAPTTTAMDKRLRIARMPVSISAIAVAVRVVRTTRRITIAMIKVHVRRVQVRAFRVPSVVITTAVARRRIAALVAAVPVGGTVGPAIDITPLGRRSGRVQTGMSVGSTTAALTVVAVATAVQMTAVQTIVAIRVIMGSASSAVVRIITPVSTVV